MENATHKHRSPFILLCAISIVGLGTAALMALDVATGPCHGSTGATAAGHVGGLLMARIQMVLFAAGAVVAATGFRGRSSRSPSLLGALFTLCFTAAGLAITLAKREWSEEVFCLSCTTAHLLAVASLAVVVAARQFSFRAVWLALPRTLAEVGRQPLMMGVTLALLAGLSIWPRATRSEERRALPQELFRPELLGSEAGRINLMAAMRESQDPATLGLESPGATVTLTVFTDYQCPGCRAVQSDYVRAFAALQERHGQRVAVNWRHFPLDVTCNGSVASAGSPGNSCAAAMISEMARAQGLGRIDDWLSVVSRNVPADELQSRARELGLRVDRKALDAAKEKVAADIALGRKAGVTELPALFMNGTRLPPIAPDVIAFLVDKQLDGREKHADPR